MQIISVDTVGTSDRHFGAFRALWTLSGDKAVNDVQVFFDKIDESISLGPLSVSECFFSCMTIIVILKD